MATTANASGWSLEVVRGRRPGQIFALAGCETILGSDPSPPAVGIDLAGQEVPTARRMEGHHAALSWSARVPSIRDLDSSCGTFVNRRRVLPGQICVLRAGDEIQIGAVVLRVCDGSAAATNGAAIQTNGTFAYALEGGPTCRSWDDFLVASAQKWDVLGGELASGRIDAFLAGIGRQDLKPRSAIGSDGNDRLDAWLASLPTTRPSRPELDVHPKRVVIRATAGGGMISRTVRVSNVGFRLLRCSAHVEPSDLTWLRLPPQFENVAFTAVEQTELAFEVVIPENLPISLVGEIVVEGNGGTKRIEIVLEPRREAGTIEEPEPLDSVLAPVAGWLGQASPRAAIVGTALVLGAFRLIVAAANFLPGPTPTSVGPDLGRVALAFGVVGLLACGALAARREGWREAFSGGFAGGCVGLLASAVVVAVCRAVEPTVLGPWSTSTVVACGLWAAIGAGVVGVTKAAGRFFS